MAADRDLLSTHAPQRSLLVLAARAFLGTAGDEETNEALRFPFDRALAGALARREGMSGLVAHELERLKQGSHLDLSNEPFLEETRATFIQNGRLLAELETLRRDLKAAGVPAIVLKGGALLHTVYGGRLALRPLSDIDLLFEKADLPRVQQILRDRGYRSSAPSSSFFTSGRAAFDLHVDLVGARRIPTRSLAFRLAPEALWREAVPLADRGEPLLTLAPTHQWLHLAFHAQKHSYPRLIGLVELGWLAQRLDWVELSERARSAGALRSATYAALALEKILGIAFPEPLRARGIALNRAERVFVNAVVERRPMRALGEILFGFAIPSWRGRIGYYREYLLPAREVLAEARPGRSLLRLYAARIRSLIARGLAEARVVGRRPRRSSRLTPPETSVGEGGDRRSARSARYPPGGSMPPLPRGSR